MELHLAQYNIAHLRQPLDHPASQAYVATLDAVNARAEASPGFVWRHGIDSRDTSTHVYDDPLTLVNASVWASPKHLRDYVFTDIHREVFKRRSEWFDWSGAVMWWVPAGEIPTLEQGMRRLEFLQRHGPTPYGFETGQRFPTLVVTTRPAHEVPGEFEADEPVHVAVFDGEVVGAVQGTRTWRTPVAPEWLDDVLAATSQPT